MAIRQQPCASRVRNLHSDHVLRYLFAETNAGVIALCEQCLSDHNQQRFRPGYLRVVHVKSRTPSLASSVKLRSLAMARNAATRKLFGDVAPPFAEYTDKVLFGDVWERSGLSPRDRSLVTCRDLARRRCRGKDTNPRRPAIEFYRLLPPSPRPAQRGSQGLNFATLSARSMEL